MPPLLSTYPKRRPDLPEAYREIYTQEYRLNRGGKTLATSLTARLESWMHRKVARASDSEARLLEIGGGSLNHVPYEAAAQYDVVEPFEPLYTDSPYRKKVRRIFRDLRDVPRDSRYNRILSIAVLEHLECLPEVLARSALLLEEDGLVQHAIPSEGGFLWGLAWRSTTGLAYRLRTGLPYGVLMRYEHINDHAEILSLIRWFYEEVRLERFPTPWFHLSFYTYIEARHPRLERCRDYLA